MNHIKHYFSKSSNLRSKGKRKSGGRGRGKRKRREERKEEKTPSALQENGEKREWRNTHSLERKYLSLIRRRKETPG